MQIFVLKEMLTAEATSVKPENSCSVSRSARAWLWLALPGGCLPRPVDASNLGNQLAPQVLLKPPPRQALFRARGTKLLSPRGQSWQGRCRGGCTYNCLSSFVFLMGRITHGTEPVTPPHTRIWVGAPHRLTMAQPSHT